MKNVRFPHVLVSASGDPTPATVVVPAPCEHPSPRTQKTSMFSVNSHGANGCTLSRCSSNSRVRSILPWCCPRQVKVWQVPSPAGLDLLPRRFVGVSGGGAGPLVEVTPEIFVLKNLFFRQILRHLESGTRLIFFPSCYSPVSPEADTRVMKGGRKV